MNQTSLATTDKATAIDQVVVQGDLSKLSAPERVHYYKQVCDSLGLNPYTKPFDYITLNGKLTLYPKKDCTDQLRTQQRVSVTIVSRERLEDIYVVTARATMPDGRSDESVGAVNIANLKGDMLANALMKAETKAKRRVTLSICGLGWTDETEMETIPNARPVNVDTETGEILEDEVIQPQPTQQHEPPTDAMKRKLGALRTQKFGKSEKGERAYRKMLGHYYQTDSSTKLNKAEMSNFIDRLEKLPDAPKEETTEQHPAQPLLDAIHEKFPGSQEVDEEAVA